MLVRTGLQFAVCECDSTISKKISQKQRSLWWGQAPISPPPPNREAWQWRPRWCCRSSRKRSECFSSRLRSKKNELRTDSNTTCSEDEEKGHWTNEQTKTRERERDHHPTITCSASCSSSSSITVEQGRAGRHASLFQCWCLSWRATSSCYLVHLSSWLSLAGQSHNYSTRNTFQCQVQRSGSTEKTLLNSEEEAAGVWLPPKSWDVSEKILERSLWILCMTETLVAVFCMLWKVGLSSYRIDHSGFGFLIFCMHQMELKSNKMQVLMSNIEDRNHVCLIVSSSWFTYWQSLHHGGERNTCNHPI